MRHIPNAGCFRSRALPPELHVPALPVTSELERTELEIRGRNLADLVSRETRDRIRRGLAFGKSRKAPDFPPDLIDRMRRDLAEDAKRFRELTGRPFSSWSV